ncbi:MAG: hypothetical protein A3H96_08790 [Acidobacteria bacterium RIFCSPLOWO2_02_FULL_67_36]|nr:MAG: hypothetical protein A3H96_08790 [Acidobacteria bacterium RIFCSPLOWO2_02_FULL_67_36]OFW21067.1 MAG: hypothetical protein A3G21_14190 [Acidobacteria bacterium RIFCSPLOWO2_12_FULL_66_21]
MSAAILAESLTKYYGAVVGVEHLNLSVARGEVYGFLGPNGAGKTTTIRLLLDLVRPTRGRILVNGRDCRTSSRAVREQIGYLPSEMPLYPEMSGAAYLKFLGALQQRVDDGWLRRLLGRFDVSDVDLERRLGDLSHGMRRKFGILQALMGRAPILVLDEPTSGLDPLMIEAFAETVLELKAAGTTIFLSSHVLSEVERLCDRVGIIKRGTLARQTSIAELRAEMPRRVRVAFAGAAPAIPPSLRAGVKQAGTDYWKLEWQGALGPMLDALHGLQVADIEIDPFRLEEYVLDVYSREERAAR